jgi:PAS domain S-box-containing protein
MAGKPTYEELEQRIEELEREVSEHKKTEDALRENEGELEAIFHAIGEGIAIIDMKGKVTRINKRISEVGGYSEKEILGKRITSLKMFTRPSIGKILRNFTRLISGKRTSVFEVEIYTKEGKKLNVELRGSPLRKKKKIIGMVGTVRDITERKRIEEALGQRAEEFAALYKTSLEITKSQDLPVLLETIVERAVRLLSGTSGGMYLCDPHKEEARCVVSYRTPRDFTGTVLKHGEGAAGTVAQSGEPLIIDNYRTWSGRATVFEEEQPFTAVISVPMTWQDEVTGVIHVMDDGEERRFTKDDLELLTLFGNQAAIAIQNTRLVEQVQGHVAELERINEELQREIIRAKTAAEALRESERKFRALAEQSPNMIFINQKGRIVYVNERCEEMMGYTKDEFYSEEFDFLALIAPEHREFILKRFGKHMAGKDVEPYECALITKDDRRLESILTTRLIDYGGGTAILGTATDITERKQAEEALQQEKERFRILVEESPLGVSLIGADGRYKYINPTFTEIFSCALEDIPTGREWFRRAYPDPDYRHQVISTWITDQEASKVGEVRPRTFTVRCKDGSDKEILFRSVTMENGDQFVTYEDMTERMKLEAQLQHAQRMEAIGTLAGGIAHDFNNILSAIIGYTEIALFQEPSEGSSVHHSLEQVLGAAERAKDLVKQILAFSRQAEEERRPVLIEPLVKEALKLLRATLPTTIEIRQSIAPHEGSVMADPTQIHQVLMNLCTNAHHAMREKGGVLEVRLESATLDADEAAARDLRSGRYLALSVNDTGCGMSPEVVGRIFDPYFTTKEKAVGTGLGLAVVHGIVKGHGGAISVESKPGKGSTFTVYLPLIKDAKLPEEVMREGSLPTGDERILLIDDEPTLVDIGIQMLERLGYRVVTRTSSTEALELFRSAPEDFDLVITDQTMPRMTGDELAKEIMKLRPGTPIILCTGFSERISEHEARRMGIKAFLMKPVVITALAKTIRKILDEEH